MKTFIAILILVALFAGWVWGVNFYAPNWRFVASKVEVSNVQAEISGVKESQKNQMAKYLRLELRVEYLEKNCKQYGVKPPWNKPPEFTRCKELETLLK